MYKQYLLIQRAQWGAKHKSQIEFLGKLEQKVVLRKCDVQNRIVLNKINLFLSISLVCSTTVLKES